MPCNTVGQDFILAAGFRTALQPSTPRRPLAVRASSQETNTGKKARVTVQSARSCVQMFKTFILILWVLGTAALFGASRNLEIYWIDAEGGAATLIVSPSGQSMLVDTANRAPDDRDAKRIMAAIQQAGLKKIDILLTTHFHSDHIGAMPALAKLIPIDLYMDHGESVEMARPQVAAAYKAYVELSQGKRKSLVAGDRIPLKGVDIQVIMSAGKGIVKGLKGVGPNAALCQDWKEKTTPEPDPDNDMSVGFLLKFGKFKFLDIDR